MSVTAPYDLTIVLDDDPTGTQAVQDVPVLLRWDREAIAAAADGTRALHLMTNARALRPADAGAITEDAAGTALAARPGARLVLRGDSTLRGHLLEEYEAVRHAAFPDRPPVLLLVPALPAAGRITLGGVHLLVADGTRRALHDTEYARDGSFAYRSARLLDWAAERSGGLLDPAAGAELPRAALHAGGPDAVAAALATVARASRPAACAPDAVDLDDLATIAAGVRRAEAAGVPVLVRCAPAFAAVLDGTLADGFVPAPRASTDGVLVLCGSYVPNTTRQLAHLLRSFGARPIEPDVQALAGDRAAAQAEVARAAAAARCALDGGLAVVSTPRERPSGTTSLEAGARIAQGLAAVLAALDPPPDVVVAKGGITSHVAARDGLGAVQAQVVGPVAAGVALWRVPARGREVAFLVFPGNVGTEDALTAVVRRVVAA